MWSFHVNNYYVSATIDIVSMVQLVPVVGYVTLTALYDIHTMSCNIKAQAKVEQGAENFCYTKAPVVSDDLE